MMQDASLPGVVERPHLNALLSFVCAPLSGDALWSPKRVNRLAVQFRAFALCAVEMCCDVHLDCVAVCERSCRVHQCRHVLVSGPFQF